MAGAIALTLGLRPQPAEGQVVMGWIFSELLSTPTFNVGFDIGMNFSTLTGLENATLGYGVGNYFAYNGRRDEADAVLAGVLEGAQWAAFGYIAAEADGAR